MGISYTPMSISREEYDRLRRLIRDDDALPESYDLWLEHSDKEIDDRRAQGAVIAQPFEVHAQQFADWCRRSGFNPNAVTLMAFVAQRGQR